MAFTRSLLPNSTAHDTRCTTHLIHGLEGFAERALADARLREVGLPQQVGVAKHQLDRVTATATAIAAHPDLGGLFCLGRLSVRIEVRAADDAARTDDVEHDLDVERPVSRVVEDEDRGNRDA